MEFKFSLVPKQLKFCKFFQMNILIDLFKQIILIKIKIWFQILQ